MSAPRGRVWLALAVALLAPAAAGAQPSPPADAVRGKTAEVFDRPEFRPDKPGPGNWLLRQLRDFFLWLGSLHEGSPLLFWLILVGCLVALAALLVLMAYQIRSAFGGGGRDRAAARDAAAQRIRLSTAHKAEADRRAAAGDYTEAVRFLFLSLVYRLDERGRVSFHKEYTNREYLELVGERLHVRDALRVLVDALDDHWYAQRPCGRERYEACLAVYDRLLAA
jgi:hypothetical protein